MPYRLATPQCSIAYIVYQISFVLASIFCPKNKFFSFSFLLPLYAAPPRLVAENPTSPLPNKTGTRYKNFTQERVQPAARQNNKAIQAQALKTLSTYAFGLPQGKTERQKRAQGAFAPCAILFCLYLPENQTSFLSVSAISLPALVPILSAPASIMVRNCCASRMPPDALTRQAEPTVSLRTRTSSAFAPSPK